jgi:hypothetical protein
MPGVSQVLVASNVVTVDTTSVAVDVLTERWKSNG